MKHLRVFCSLFIFILFVYITSIVNTGCKKSPTTTIVKDTIIPPPPADTISYVKKIEETFLQSNPTIDIRTRDYNFYYDNQNRLITVGIKNYGPVLYDSLTTKLTYVGNNKLPSVVIMPNLKSSSINGPAFYDTTYFTYGSNGVLIKDSSNERLYKASTSTYYRNPMYRLYAHPNGNTLKIDWYSGGSSPILQRIDTVIIGTDKINSLKMLYPSYDPRLDTYSRGENFISSSFINPLAKLNISGTPFSLIYTNVRNEILGNSNHYLITGTNILAYYLDFISPRIPQNFSLGAYNATGGLIGSQLQYFTTQITPWAVRSNYPQLIKVAATTSLPDDKFQYRYYY